MEKIVSLCKRKGFIFQSAEIYGGLNGCWDYGPLGAELKRNLKDYWWRVNVQERPDIVGMRLSADQGALACRPDSRTERHRLLVEGRGPQGWFLGYQEGVFHAGALRE